MELFDISEEGSGSSRAREFQRVSGGQVSGFRGFQVSGFRREQGIDDC